LDDDTPDQAPYATVLVDRDDLINRRATLQVLEQNLDKHARPLFRLPFS
jgi:hypothetical protein